MVYIQVERKKEIRVIVTAIAMIVKIASVNVLKIN